MLCPFLTKHIINKILLNGTEGYNTYAVIAQVFIAQTADYLRNNCFGFRLVMLGLTLIIKAFGMNNANFGNKVVM